jgi:hypothetical protein
VDPYGCRIVPAVVVVVVAAVVAVGGGCIGKSVVPGGKLCCSIRTKYEVMLGIILCPLVVLLVFSNAADTFLAILRGMR